MKFIYYVYLFILVFNFNFFSNVFLFQYERSCCLSFDGKIVCNQNAGCSGSVNIDYKNILNYMDFNFKNKANNKFNNLFEEIKNFSSKNDIYYKNENHENENIISLKNNIKNNNNNNVQSKKKEDIVFQKLVKIGRAKRD